MSTESPKSRDESSQSLSDADISTERVLQRRSFLTRTGVLMGGALAIAAGVGRGAYAADTVGPSAQEAGARDDKRGITEPGQRRDVARGR